jgi:hypothetical protein
MRRDRFTPNQLELGGFLHGQIARLLPFEENSEVIAFTVP